MTASVVALPLWPHQEELIAFSRERVGSLWDAGMGVGKSRAAIVLAEKWGPSVRFIFAPKKACLNVWPKQIAMYGSQRARVVQLGTDKLSAKQKGAALDAACKAAVTLGQTCYVIINYDAAWRPGLAEAIARNAGLGAAFCDEVHRLKSPQGKASKFFGTVARRFQRRVGLTGTVMPHSPLDVFGTARFVDPALFGWSFVQFRARYAKLDTRFGHPRVVGFQNIPELQAKLRTVTVHVPRSVLRLEEPLHERVPVSLCPRARSAYSAIDQDLRAEVDQGTLTVANAMVRVLRLQQVTGGLLPLDDGPGTIIDSAKCEALADLLEGVADDEPFVVFARFRHDLDRIHEAAKSLGRRSLECSGRVDQVAEWTRGDAPILAVQVGAGSESIDLTRAAYGAFYSVGHSLGQFEQACARLHRPGQTRRVCFYHLVASRTVDGVIYESLRAKRDVIESIMAAVRERRMEQEEDDAE